jgi:hypothetical protein
MLTMPLFAIPVDWKALAGFNITSEYALVKKDM